MDRIRRCVRIDVFCQSRLHLDNHSVESILRVHRADSIFRRSKWSGETRAVSAHHIRHTRGIGKNLLVTTMSRLLSHDRSDLFDIFVWLLIPSQFIRMPAQEMFFQWFLWPLVSLRGSRIITMRTISHTDSYHNKVKKVLKRMPIPLCGYLLIVD